MEKPHGKDVQVLSLKWETHLHADIACLWYDYSIFMKSVFIKSKALRDLTGETIMNHYEQASDICIFGGINAYLQGIGGIFGGINAYYAQKWIYFYNDKCI